MIIPFTFEGDEVEVLMEAVCLLSLSPAKQPRMPANRAKLASLKRFVDRMGPVIKRGAAEERRNTKAQMN